MAVVVVMVVVVVVVVVVVEVVEEEVVQQTLEEVNNKDQPEGLVVEGLEAAAAAATDETPKLSHKGDRNYIGLLPIDVLQLKESLRSVAILN